MIEAQAPRRRPACLTRGFTLVEMIAVLALLGALFAIASLFIARPFLFAQDLSRRAALVDAADNALDRITREVRAAIPNTVRISDDQQALELLRMRLAGRYRAKPTPSGSGDPLDFELPADAFEVLGDIACASLQPRNSGSRECADGQGDCLVIYSTGAGAAVYTGQAVAALTEVDTNGGCKLSFDSGENTGPAFPAPSPRHRFQVLATAVSYICDPIAGTISRYYGYGLQATQPNPPNTPNNNLLLEDVTACAFDYQPGTATRRGLLTLDLTLQRAGEQVRLLDQAQVFNTP